MGQSPLKFPMYTYRGGIYSYSRWFTSAAPRGCYSLQTTHKFTYCQRPLPFVQHHSSGMFVYMYFLLDRVFWWGKGGMGYSIQCILEISFMTVAWHINRSVWVAGLCLVIEIWQELHFWRLNKPKNTKILTIKNSRSVVLSEGHLVYVPINFDGLVLFCLKNEENFKLDFNPKLLGNVWSLVR